MAYQVNDRMDIGEATVGISRKGIVNYQQDVHMVVNDVQKELRDYKSVVDSISLYWNGAAAQRFVNNLDKSVEKACSALESIEKAMDALFQTIRDGMIKQDNELVDDNDIAF